MGQTETTSGAPRVYRNMGDMVGAAAFGMLLLFIGLSALVLGASMLQKAGEGGVFLLAGAASITLANKSVKSVNDGIAVTNFARRRRYRWNEIDGFQLGRWTVWSQVCLIRLTDGRVRPALAIAESNWATGSAKRAVAELNRELAARRAHPGEERLGKGEESVLS
jgi:hypothetical protein